jgi:hypothetical protein
MTMATERKITPAPKPSAKGKEVAPDDALTGTVTVRAETLREDAKKLRELLAAPDGTPGKDVALRVQAEQERAKSAAPIVAAAVKDVKQWQQLHGKAAAVTKSLAAKLVQLRTDIYTDAEGRPDVRGRSQEYRDAAASIYTKAGIEADSQAHALQANVRYYANTRVREVLRADERFAGGDEAKYLELCEYYKINPESALERQQSARRAVEGGSRLPALKLDPTDVAAMWTGAATYSLKALEIPGDTDPAMLPDDQRAALREELEAVRDRADTLLDRLGDDDE